MSQSALLSPAPFGRMLTAMVTPFDGNGKVDYGLAADLANYLVCLLYTSPSPRDATLSRMPSSA